MAGAVSGRRTGGARGSLERTPNDTGATPALVAEAIIQMRQARPSWGPRKIIAKLALEQPDLAWPAPLVAGDILQRAGLVVPRRLRRHTPPKPLRLGDETRCEPLTTTDSFCRYLLTLPCGTGTTEAEARAVFEAASAEFGLPEAIRSDNGPPFASTGVTGLTALSVWWIKLGIRPERIAPGKPQQNGRHERFRLTLLEAMQPPEANRRAQAARFAAFRQDYNQEDPIRRSSTCRPPACPSVGAQAPHTPSRPRLSRRSRRAKSSLQWRD